MNPFLPYLALFAAAALLAPPSITHAAEPADDVDAAFDDALDSLDSADRQAREQRRKEIAERYPTAPAGQPDPLMDDFDSALGEVDSVGAAEAPGAGSPAATPARPKGEDPLLDDWDAAMEDLGGTSATPGGDPAAAAAAAFTQLLVSSMAEAFSGGQSEDEKLADERNRLAFDYVKLVEGFGLNDEQKQEFFDTLVALEKSAPESDQHKLAMSTIKQMLGEEHYRKFTAFRANLKQQP
jgi:hypothetical protein